MQGHGPVSFFFLDEKLTIPPNKRNTTKTRIDEYDVIEYNMIYYDIL